MSNHYLYRHIRNDNDEIFYIGVGTKTKEHSNTHKGEYSRAYAKGKTDRGEFWHNVVNKGGYRVEILFESDDYDFMKEKEIKYIAFYGRRDLGKGKLVNLTDGGEGSRNIVISEETSRKISEANMGHAVSDETKLAISQANTGKKRTEEVKKAKSIAMSGGNHKNAKLTLHLETGIYYDTIQESADTYGITRSALSNKVNGNRTNDSNIVFAENIGDSCYPILPIVNPPYVPIKLPESVEKWRATMKGRVWHNGVLVLDTLSGIFYYSIKEASIALGLNRNTLTQRLRGTLENNTNLIRV